jgi:predicted Zn-dependent peptidase
MYRAAGVDLYGEPYRTLDQLLAEIDAITEDQVRAVCRDYFAPAAQTVVSLGPKSIQ